MTSTAEEPGSGGPEDGALLPPEESLDDDELGDLVDEGYSPAERPWGINAWGTTAAEGAGHEDLDHRLAREVREPDDDGGDGIGDVSDTDGEPVDGEVGAARAGRLTAWDTDRGSDLARDVGIDGGAASAEEAAVHVVPDMDG